MNELTVSNLEKFVDEKLADTDCFLVDASISKSDVVVTVDSDTRVDIDFVADLSREIEAHFAPEIDDFNLEVGSAGLTSPLKVKRQYLKNIGKDLEVTASDGKKYHGLLINADDDGITLEVAEKVKKEGAKRPVTEQVKHEFKYPEIKKAVYELKF